MLEICPVDLWIMSPLVAHRGQQQTHLCNGADSYRILIKNFEHLVEWPFEGPFDDLLSVHE